MPLPVLPYKSDKLRIDLDPGRKLVIDSPPIGLLRALKVKTYSAAVIVILFAIFCASLPLVAVCYVYFLRHEKDVLPFLFIAPIAQGIVCLILFIIYYYRATIHLTLIATPDTLIIDKCGFGDPSRLVIPRDNIEIIGACYTKSEETSRAAMAFALHIRRRRYDMDDIFLDHLPHEDVQTITNHLCAMLNLPLAPPDPR